MTDRLHEAAQDAADYRPMPDACMDNTPAGYDLINWWAGWTARRDALRAALAQSADVKAHDHQFDIACTVCGQPGMVKVEVIPR